jgi:uncharacterized protein YvpB
MIAISGSHFLGSHSHIEWPLALHYRHLMKTIGLFGMVAILFFLVMGLVAWLKTDDEAAIAEEIPQGETRQVEADQKAFDPKVSGLGSTLFLPVEQAAEGVRQELDAQRPTGWQSVDGHRRYVEKGEPVVGEVVVGGVIYTLDDQGYWLSTRLDAPYISQLPDMPSGCEVVAVTMMLNHAGIAVTKEEVAEALPYAGDANFGFTGSLYDEGNSFIGGIIWPPALLDLVASYKGTAVDLTGAPWEELCQYLESGKPVCVWFRFDELDHTVLLTGYSDTTVWYNDPLVEKDVELDLDTFLLWWAGNEYRALSY